ncbi:hypothetical protein HMPREF0514_10295 [Lactobacillus paragasseri JV-V03]|uniref:Uncharacterized protein n=1 Tax=Lactobacillus paragasseri JV-V03 TaxID=525326 RepID=A0AA87A478_9LACO|nr:hypothetical protein [Lactobacillus paragasseri]EFJ69851.1 hypothetical protein HMPREF0514_10295 [Lactobacillus paragasseri JV-V03]
MEIKYPKAEMLIVLGEKNYAVYTDVSINTISRVKKSASRNEDLAFNIAKRKNGSFWYPSCSDPIIWTTALINKRVIKAILEVPEPKVKLDYSDDNYDDVPF